MDKKRVIFIQKCTLTREELIDFLNDYPIPDKFNIMIPYKNQSIFDALEGFVSLYYNLFSQSNLRIPLHPFFLEVLPYYDVHISRLNPFGLAKLTTYIVMCRAYGFKPTLNAFRGFLNLGPAGDWLTFFKRVKSKNEESFGIGSPSVSVNNNNVDVGCTAGKGPRKTFIQKEITASNSFVSNHKVEGDHAPYKAVEGQGSVSETLEVHDYEKDWHGLPCTKELPNAMACHVTMKQVTPQAWTNIMESMSLEKLLDLHDNGYTRQAMMDNHLNDMVRDMIRVYKETRKELRVDVAREAKLKAKYDDAVVGLDENLIVVSLRKELKSLKGQLKEHEDKAEVVSKVVSYISMEPYHCDEVGQNVENLVKAAIFHERCSALEEMDATKKPVDLSKVECYRPSDEEEYNKAGNAYVTAEYPFLIEATRDPSTAL
nr:hypothetical protein [Tanacetum cinerariifolium]